MDFQKENISEKTLNNLIKELSNKAIKERINRISIVNDLEDAISNLKNAYNEEELVLVLGAGVSAPYKLPDWASLLQNLLFETFNNGDSDSDASHVLSKIFTEIFPNSPLISARYLQEYFKEHVSERNFEQMVKEALYERIKRDTNSATVSEVVKLCISPGRSPNLDSIITYNYDDILETTLEKSETEVPYKTIYKDGMAPINNELPIYHVHGYLPQNSEIDKEQSLTLSENLYHKQYMDTYSWNNLVQINKFRDKICLFIGTSLTDPNIRRLLDISWPQRKKSERYHYLFKLEYKLEDVENKLEEILSENGKLLNEKSKANMQFKETAEKLMNKIEEFEEIDAMSFGIKIIRIKEYEDIPVILKKIRKK